MNLSLLYHQSFLTCNSNHSHLPPTLPLHGCSTPAVIIEFEMKKKIINNCLIYIIIFIETTQIVFGTQLLTTTPFFSPLYYQF